MKSKKQPADVGFMPIINKIADRPDANPESIAQMMKTQLDWQDRKEEREFHEAIARVQEKVSHIKIVKDQKVNNDRGGYFYAKMQDIDKIVRPFLNNEKIKVSYPMRQGSHEMYEIVCRLSHGRFQEETAIFMPLMESDAMNEAQGMGTIQQYGMRRSLCAALNIIVVDEDTDGIDKTPVTPEQVLIIKTGFKNTGLDEDKFLKTMNIANVEELQQIYYDAAINLISATKWDQSVASKTPKGKE